MTKEHPPAAPEPAPHLKATSPRRLGEIWAPHPMLPPQTGHSRGWQPSISLYSSCWVIPGASDESRTVWAPSFVCVPPYCVAHFVCLILCVPHTVCPSVSCHAPWSPADELEISLQEVGLHRALAQLQWCVRVVVHIVHAHLLQDPKAALPRGWGGVGISTITLSCFALDGTAEGQHSRRSMPCPRAAGVVVQAVESAS